MNITVYTKPNCQPCRATKRWLDDRGITYREEDATHPDNAAAIRFIGYQQAPVVLVSTAPGHESHWSGFNPVELERHLGKDAA